MFIIAYITLNRPERLNALSRKLLSELGEALEASANDDDVRCIVIRGAGRAFSAGYDMNVQSQGALSRAAVTMINNRPDPTEKYKSCIWNISSIYTSV